MSLWLYGSAAKTIRKHFLQKNFRRNLEKIHTDYGKHEIRSTKSEINSNIKIKKIQNRKSL